MKVVLLVTQNPARHVHMQTTLATLSKHKFEFDAPISEIKLFPVWAALKRVEYKKDDFDVIGVIFDSSMWNLGPSAPKEFLAELKDIKKTALMRGIRFREYLPDLTKADVYKLARGEQILDVTDRNTTVVCVEGEDSRIHDANDFHLVWPNHVQNVSRWCYAPMEPGEDLPPVRDNFIVLDGIADWTTLSDNLYARILNIISSEPTVTSGVMWRRPDEEEFHILNHEDLVVPKSRSGRCMLIVSEDTLLSEKYVLPQGGNVMEISPFADGSRLTARNAFTHIVIDTRSRLHPSLADKLQELEDRGVPTIRYSEGN